MSLNRWLLNLRSALGLSRGQRNRARQGLLRSATHPLNLEALEDRSLLAVIAPADFNGDAILDVATLDYDEHYVSTISVSLGNADGTFQPARTTASVPDVQSVAVGDFNTDGMLDLATGSYDYYNTTGNDVSILLGNGDGTFETPVSLNLQPVGLVSWFVATGDLNADGMADLVVTSNPPLDSFGHSTVRVLIGHGDSTFSTAAYTGTNDVMEDFYTPVLADFDRDGNVDVAVPATRWQQGLIKVYLGNGDGTLQTRRDYVTYSGETYWAAVRVDDFNGDGWLDLAATNSGLETILLGNGDGTFGNGPLISVSNATVTEGNTGTANATFVVSLSTNSNIDVTVHYTTANSSAAAGSDYTAVSGDVTIPAGQISRTFTVAVIGDRIPELPETFTVLLSAPTNAMLGDNQGTGMILDNEPRISISDFTKAEGKNGKSTSFTFTVTLSSAYDQAVTMSFRTVNGTATTGDNDYIAKTGTLTFAPGQTSKTITIDVKGDSKKESNETFYLDLFGLSNNALFTKNRGIGTILNDD